MHHAMLPALVLVLLAAHAAAQCNSRLEYEGHTYDVYPQDLNWLPAMEYAATQKLGNKVGHLAVLSTQAEWVVVRDWLNTGGCKNYRGQSLWLAGSDNAESGKWIWEAGPEKGTHFWQGLSNGYRVNGNFEAWQNGEPNDYFNNRPTDNSENCLQQYAASNNALWNDIPCTGNYRYFSLIEYEANYLQVGERVFQFVPGAFTYDEAKTIAKSSTYLGAIGSLATVTLTEEADTIAELIGSAGAWIAGKSVSATEWAWDSSDEEGEIFYDGAVVGSNLNLWQVNEPSQEGCVRAVPGSPIAWDAVPCSNNYGILIEYLTPAWSFCPEDDVLIATTNVGGTAAPDWSQIQAVVHPNFEGIEPTATHNETDVFPLGETEVTFTLNVDELDPFHCRVKVRVFYGIGLQAGGIQPTDTPRQDFIVDADGRFEEAGVPIVPSFTGNVVDNGFTFLLSAPKNKPISVQLNDGDDFNFVVLLQWCSSGGLSNAVFDPLDVTVEAIGSAKSAAWSNFGSAMTADGRCFRLAAKSTAFNQAGVVTVTVLRVTIDSPTPIRRRRAIGDKPYSPASPGFIVTNMTGNGSTFVQDVTPPTFVGCPQDISVFSTPGSLNAPASWNEPVAQDNAAVFSVTSTHSPGDGFSIITSPHTVTYTATDTAGLTAQCSFQVSVVFQVSSYSFTHTIQPEHLKTATIPPPSGIGSTVVRDYIVGPNYGSANVPNLTVSLSDYNAITLSMQAPPGQVIVVEPGDQNPQLTIDLAWSDGTAVASADGASFVQVKFFSLALPNGDPHPHGLAYDATFAVTSAVVKEGFLRLTALTTPLGLGSFSMQRITAVLAYPAGYSVNQTQAFKAQSFNRLAFSYSYDQASDIPEGRHSTVQLKDITPPEFSNCPVDRNVTAPEDAGSAEVSWIAPGVTDNLLLASNVPTHTPPTHFDITDFNDGAEQVSYRAEDAAGNVAYCNFTVTVYDVTPPTAVCPDAVNFSLPTTASKMKIPEFALTPANISDNSNRTQVIYPDQVAVGIGNHSYVVYVADVQDNRISCTVNVSVLDTTAPVFTSCPVSTAKNTPNKSVVFEWETPVAKDNSGSFQMNSTHTSGDSFSEGSTVVEYYATDGSGNIGVCSFTVSVIAPEAAQGTPTGTVAGMSAGAFVLAALVVLIAVFLRRREIAKANRPYDFDELCAMLAKSLEGPDGVKIPRELKRGNLKLLDELGHGNFGKVFKALFEETYSVFGQPGFLVAVKQLHDEATGADKTELLKEAAFMAQLSHPHIVGLQGVVTQGKPVMMVIDYCEFGALSSYLQEKADSLGDGDRNQFAYDIALGMEYLASLSVVHRDLAARNVLVTSERRCKISDFGLSRETQQEAESAYYQASTKGHLPVRWTAPESLEDRKFSVNSDIWSYGIVLFEIWTDGATPYKGWTNQKVWVSVVGGYRLPCPDGCKEEVHELMLKCWHADHHQRIKAAECVRFFAPRVPLSGNHFGANKRNSKAPQDSEFYQNFVAGGIMDEDELSDEEDNESKPKAVHDPTDDLPLYDAGDADDDAPAGAVKVSIPDDEPALYDTGDADGDMAQPGYDVASSMAQNPFFENEDEDSIMLTQAGRPEKAAYIKYDDLQSVTTKD